MLPIVTFSRNNFSFCTPPPLTRSRSFEQPLGKAHQLKLSPSHMTKGATKNRQCDSATTSVTSGSLHHLHTATASRHDGYPPCATIPAARILYPPHGSTPRADTTIHNRQPSATLECVTRCLTFSVASTTEKLPSSNGTFLDVHSTYSGLCICIECVFADILIYIHRHP